MADPKHLAILKQGVDKWNQWRRENPNVKANLSAADLRSANLSAANLAWAKLSNPG